MNKNKIDKSVIILLFLIPLFGYTILNFGLFTDDLMEYIRNQQTIQSLSKKITKALKSDDLLFKDNFININGLYGRVSGRRIYNDVILLNNGMLTKDLSMIPDIPQKTRALIDFRNFASDRGTQFLYVQFPYDFDMNGDLLPRGVESYIIDDVEYAVRTFRNAGIDVLDLLPELGKTAEDITNNFYRTDNHWKPVTAFRAFQMMVGHISALFPEENFDPKVTDPANWTVHENPDQFLGSRGKRVGKYFAGLDSIQWMTPDFDSDLSIYIPQQKRFIHGDYEDVFLIKKYFKKGLNVLHNNHYCIYIGGNYPLTMIRNAHASSSKKILIIQDSFNLPLQSFFPMIFQEVDVIDPRHFEDCSINEYIDRTHPDLVIMAVNPSQAFSEKGYFEFEKPGGGDRYISSKTDVLLENAEIVLSPSESTSNNKILYESFENNKIYTLSVPAVEITQGETDGISVILYDKRTKDTAAKIAFDIPYCNETGTCRWTFGTPESNSANLQLRVYAGVRGYTKDIGITLSGLQLVRSH